MRRRLVWIIGAGIVVLAAVFVFVALVVVSSGAPTADAAMLEKVRERSEDADVKVVASRRWGEGRFIVATYPTENGSRVALGFALEQRRGWRITAYTEETAQPKDVGVGSLLVASSDGGTGQPPWSVATGILSDGNIARVEIRWASGEVTAARQRDSAYLVIESGTTTPLEARFLAKDGSEIAKVPID